MKGLIITSKGIENIACIEVNELINAKCKAENGCVVFEFKDLRELCLLCYKCQSADRAVCLIGSFGFRDFFNDFKKFIEKLELGEWLKDYKRFKVECIRSGTHDFRSVDVEANAAELILKKPEGRGIEVGLRNCEIIFLVYIVDNKCYFGVDFAGFELNKRDYKIFLHPNSLRGTIAYSLVRESGFGKKDVMLDPFSRDGVIAIEAAFYAGNFPPAYYKKDKFAFLKLDIGIDFEKFFEDVDKNIQKTKADINCFDHLFKCVDYSKKNAKIAGVDKQINFSRVELEWLDIKFREKSVDRVVTNPPTSKNADLGRIYNEFFYQCRYILKDSGTVSLIARLPDFAKVHAEKHNFLVSKEKEVWSGGQLLKIIVFNRDSES